MPLLTRLDHFQRRHPIVGAPVAVFYKFLDDQGAYLAALIAFYAFFSIFPLFLILTSSLGLLLRNAPELQSDIIEAATAQIPVLGTQIQLRSLGGSITSVAVGVVGALYGSIGVANAVQNAMNVAWNVPRNRRPNPFALRLRSLLLLLMLGVFVMGTTLLSQVGAALATTTNRLTYGSQLYALGGSMLLSGVLFVGIGRLGAATAPPVRHLLPGALLASVLWQVLQYGGQTFVRNYIASAGATEGVFAIVLGLITWLYIASMCLVACLELNVVLARTLYPRALLTPMTDHVDLTPADQLAYAHLARTASLKGFQNVEVSFDHDGQNASAARARHPQPQGRSAANRIVRGPLLRFTTGMSAAQPHRPADKCGRTDTYSGDPEPVANDAADTPASPDHRARDAEPGRSRRRRPARR